MDDQVVRRHLTSLDTALSRLEPHSTLELAAYLASPDLQWFVERGLLICAQNVLDLAVHITASAGLDSLTYASSIDGLASMGVLPRDFAADLRKLGGFRNALVHAYLSVDPSKVHGVLSHELPAMRAFARLVQAYLDR
ncbi:MAG TPA: DUF86 domain-containing protein [Polyangiales bacterium]|nr:DUF86 domain-containing protein [Polyangiales bacterium]